MMFNWLIDDNQCWMTRLEKYYRVNKEKVGEGFIENKIKSYNLDTVWSAIIGPPLNIDKCISGFTYVLFLLSYNNAFKDNLCLL